MKASLILVMLSVTTLFGQSPNSDSVSPFVSIPRRDVSSDVLEFKIPLPSFDAIDIAGRSWSPTDFLDKFTVVQLWATWCIPCRKEHPALQSFTKATAMDSRLQVLTLSVDSDVDGVRAYMKEKASPFRSLLMAGYCIGC